MGDESEFSRTICTERECVAVSLDDIASAARPIVIEIESANSIADEGFGPNASCAFAIGQDTARRLSAVLFSAYVAAATGNPQSELIEGYDSEDLGLSLDVGITDTGNIGIAFELYAPKTSTALFSMIWKLEVDPKSAAQLAEALLAAAKVASKEAIVDQ